MKTFLTTPEKFPPGLKASSRQDVTPNWCSLFYHAHAELLWSTQCDETRRRKWIELQFEEYIEGQKLNKPHLLPRLLAASVWWQWTFLPGWHQSSTKVCGIIKSRNMPAGPPPTMQTSHSSAYLSISIPSHLRRGAVQYLIGSSRIFKDKLCHAAFESICVYFAPWVVFSGLHCVMCCHRIQFRVGTE